jgi:putative copper export protein
VLATLAALAKALMYGALLMAAGAPLATASLRPSEADTRDTFRMMRIAAVATMVLGIVLALLLFLRLGGAFDQPTLTAVFSSGPGAALVLQLTGAGLLLTPVEEDSSGNRWRITAALTMLGSVVFSGHAAAMGPATGALALIHVAAIAWWVGSLWMLQRICSSADSSELLRLVNRFTWLALRVVAGLIVAGILLIVALVDFSTIGWWQSDYVRVLVMKIAFVSVLLAVAAYNKFRLTPQLPRETGALRRSIRAELAVIACVLLATAVLTTYFAPESES